MIDHGYRLTRMPVLAAIDGRFISQNDRRDQVNTTSVDH